jgi:hypothetical protein
MNSKVIQKFLLSLLFAALISRGIFASASPHAQSEASTAVSILPIASVVVVSAGVSAAAGAIASIPSIPIALSVNGSYLLVRAIESTARGTLYLLERASDGAAATIEMVGQSARSASLAVGTALTVNTIGAGVILVSGGLAIAFIPNDIGRSLLRNDRITF